MLPFHFLACNKVLLLLLRRPTISQNLGSLSAISCPTIFSSSQDGALEVAARAVAGDARSGDREPWLAPGL